MTIVLFVLSETFPSVFLSHVTLVFVTSCSDHLECYQSLCILISVYVYTEPGVGVYGLMRKHVTVTVWIYMG